MKVLVAGDPASIHATRFIGLLKDLGHDVRVFDCERYYWQEEHLRDTEVYVERPMDAPINGNTLHCNLPFKHRYHRLIAGLYNKTFAKFLTNPFTHRDYRMRLPHFHQVLRKFRPDVVFSLKMQNEGYVVAAARERYSREQFPPWIHFMWGTDLEYFGKHPAHATEHMPLICRALDKVDFLIADTNRDLLQAECFGFKGVSLGKFVAPGGFDLKLLESFKLNLKDRKVILVKGRDDGFVGQALKVVSVLTQLRDRLKGYKVLFIMPTQNVETAVLDLRDRHGVDCEIAPRLPYLNLLEFFGKSRLTISASGVDGTPSFLIETIAMGSIPVHSNLNSVREWVTDGSNGLLFDIDDSTQLSEKIDRALQDDSFFEQAKVTNEIISASQLDRNILRERMRCLLEAVQKNTYM